MQFYLCFVTAFFFLKRCAVSQTAWWVLKQLPKIILVSVQTCCIHVTLKKNQVKHANIISDGATKDNKCSRKCRRWWLWKVPHRHFLNCSQMHAVWNWRGVLLSLRLNSLTHSRGAGYSTQPRSLFSSPHCTVTSYLTPAQRLTFFFLNTCFNRDSLHLLLSSGFCQSPVTNSMAHYRQVWVSHSEAGSLLALQPLCRQLIRGIVAVDTRLTLHYHFHVN